MVKLVEVTGVAIYANRNIQYGMTVWLNPDHVAWVTEARVDRTVTLGLSGGAVLKFDNQTRDEVMRQLAPDGAQ